MVDGSAGAGDQARQLADLEARLGGLPRGGSGYSGGIAALPSIREGLTAAGEGTVTALNRVARGLGDRTAGLASFLGDINPAVDIVDAFRGSGQIMQGDVVGGGSRMAGGIAASMLPGSYAQYSAVGKLLPAMFIGVGGMRRLNKPGWEANLDRARTMEHKADPSVGPKGGYTDAAKRDPVLNKNIWENTGFYKGQDNLYRTEIDTTKFKVKSPDEIGAFENLADASRTRLPEGQRGPMDWGDWSGPQLEHDVITERALANRKAAKTIRPGHYTNKIDDPWLRTTWSDFFSFPELEKAYPGLKDIELDITILPKDSYGYLAKWTPAWQETPGKITVRATLADLRKAVIHEAQHYIQRQEMFGKGSSTGGILARRDEPKVKEWLLDAGPEMRQLARDNLSYADKLLLKYPGAKAFLERVPRSKGSGPRIQPEDMKDTSWGTKDDKKIAAKIGQLRSDAININAALAGKNSLKARAQWVYGKHAGEIEARRVQKRMDYTPEQRFPSDDSEAIFPAGNEEWYGLNIPLESQIVDTDFAHGGPVYASELLHMAEGGPPKIPDLTSVPGGKREGVPDSEASQSTIKRRLALEKQQLSELLGKPVKRDVTRALEKGIQSLLDKDPLSGKRAQRMSDRIYDLKDLIDPHPFFPTMEEEMKGTIGHALGVPYDPAKSIWHLLDEKTQTPDDIRFLDQWLKQNHGKGLLEFTFPPELPPPRSRSLLQYIPPGEDPVPSATNLSEDVRKRINSVLQPQESDLSLVPESRPKDPLNLPAIISKTAALAAFDEPRPKGKGQRFRGIGSLMRRRLFPLIQAAQLGYEHLLSPEQKAEIKDFLESPAHEMVGMDKPGIEYFKDLLGMSEDPTVPVERGIGDNQGPPLLPTKEEKGLATQADKARDMFGPSGKGPGKRKLLVVGCSKGKNPVTCAVEASKLYTCSLWQMVNKHFGGAENVPKGLEDAGIDFHVLSAEHGLIPANELIETYDREMTQPRKAEILGDKKMTQNIVDVFGRYDPEDVFIAASKNYRGLIEDATGREFPTFKRGRGTGVGTHRGEFAEWLRQNIGPRSTGQGVGSLAKEARDMTSGPRFRVEYLPTNDAYVAMFGSALTSLRYPEIPTLKREKFGKKKGEPKVLERRFFSSLEEIDAVLEKSGLRRDPETNDIVSIDETSPPTNKAHGGPIYASEILHMQGGGDVVDIGASDPNRLDMADVEYTMPLWERIKEDPIALMAYDPRNITNIPGRNPGFGTPSVRVTRRGQDVRGYYSPYGPHKGTIAIHPAFTFPKSEGFREYDKGYYTGEHSFEDYYPKDVDIKEIAQAEGLDVLIHELRHKGLYDLVSGEGSELSSDERRMFLERLIHDPDSPLSHEARIRLQDLKDLTHYPHGEDARTGKSLRKHLRSHPYYSQFQRQYRKLQDMERYQPRRSDWENNEADFYTWYQTQEGMKEVDQHEQDYARAQSIALERIAKRWPGWNYEVPESSPYRSATSTGVGITEPRLSDVLKKEYDEEQKYQEQRLHEQRARKKAHGGLVSMAPEARGMFGKPHPMTKEPRLTDHGPGANPGVAGLCGVARNMNRSVVA